MSKVIWLDAQLSPLLTDWIINEFDISCIHIKTLGLKTATDKVIFTEAGKRDAILITKDSDFLDLLLANGPPPQIIWLTCGNTSNSKLKEIFKLKLIAAIKMLEGESDLVEITD